MQPVVMKPIVISKEGLAAFDESIAHWEEIVKGPTGLVGRDTCALCGVYWDRSDIYSCEGCPINAYTGKPCCEDTPYHELEDFVTNISWDIPGGFLVDTDEARALALVELNFLKMVRSVTSTGEPDATME